MDPSAIPIEITTIGGESTTLLVSGGVAVAVMIFRQVAEIAAKAISDKATGPLGICRKICKVIAGYTVNRL